jgi:hypothetical protein
VVSGRNFQISTQDQAGFVHQSLSVTQPCPSVAGPLNRALSSLAHESTIVEHHNLITSEPSECANQWWRGVTASFYYMILAVPTVSVPRILEIQHICRERTPPPPHPPNLLRVRVLSSPPRADLTYARRHTTTCASAAPGPALSAEASRIPSSGPQHARHASIPVHTNTSATPQAEAHGRGTP